MKRSEINSALKARLENGETALEGTWPNVDPQGPMIRPYFELLFPVADRAGQSLNGKLIRETGRMSVIVVVKGGTGEAVANDYAEAIGDLFPQGLRIPITGGVVTIQQPADIRGGFRDNSDWRVPVIIRYSALNRYPVFLPNIFAEGVFA